MKTLKQMTALLVGYVTGALALFAEGGPLLLMTPGFKANSDYSGLGVARYIIIGQTGAYAAQQATDPTSSLILGVLQNNPKQNKAMSIATAGLSKVVAGASANAGDIFTTNGSGRAVKVASGQMAVGRFLEAPTADGDIVASLLFPPVRWSGAA